MTDSPHPMSDLTDRVRPFLANLGRSLALLAWRVWITVGPLFRSAGRTIGRWVQRAEEATIPALIAVAGSVPRAMQRAEEVVVPAIVAFGRWLVHGLERAESRVVPALAGAGRGTAGAVTRGQGTVSTALASGGRGLVEGMQRVEAFAVPVLSPRVALPRPDGGEPRDQEEAGMARFEAEVDGEYTPGAAYLEVRQPEPSQEVWQRRIRAAGISLVGMLGTAAVVVLAIMVTARETVGSAITEGTDAVGVEFRLPDEVGLTELTERSYIYAADGQTLLQVLDREENRRIVDLAEIPLVVQQAIITAEDRRFYEHDGYDPEGIGRAFFANIESGDISQGGSTLTQQLARSAPGVGNQREGFEAFMRKFREIAYAVALEEKFSKDELLGQYLNQVYFGENAYGVAAAAEEYFGITDVRQLQVEHGALLAASVRQPNSGNPRADPETATRRRDAILDGMATEGYIPQDAADHAKSLPLGVIPHQDRVRPYDFIADSVIREFKYSPEFAQFGATPEEREQQLWFGGLRIFSSLDPRLQETAKAVISENFPTGNDPTRPTGAIVSVEPATGRILAAHSGLDYGIEQYAIPTQGRRQPGSAAKPFIYAEALRQGFPPDGVSLSGRSPAYYEDCPGWGRRDGGLQNYNGSSYGSLDMPAALKNSVNTAAVQLSRVVGVEPILGLMGQMGIDVQAATAGQVNCSMVLGGLAHGMTPVEMAGAYATFANNGVFVPPHFIDRVEDRNGNRLWEAQYPPQQVFSPEVNATMVDMMQGVVTGGTGTRARIRGWEVAGKTGTTQENKDAWFVGYTPTMATAMWMGIVENPQPMRTTGGGIPATVWQQYMVQALQGTNPVPFPEVAIPEGRLAPGQPVTVPDVTRMSRDEASATLTQVKLFPEFRPVASRASAGTIISQNPRPGTAAETGDSVSLGISTGQPPAPSPPPPTAQPAPTPQVPPPGNDDAIQAALDALGRRGGPGNGGGGPPGPDD